MCSVRSSDINFDEPECKEEHDESGASGLFNAESLLWANSNRSVHFSQITYEEESNDLVSNDNNL